jgi:hypothetical protein
MFIHSRMWQHLRRLSMKAPANQPGEQQTPPYKQQLRKRQSHKPQAPKHHYPNHRSASIAQ